MRNAEFPEYIISRLCKIADKAYIKKNYEKTLTALSVQASIMYQYNQCYKDNDMENRLIDISKATNWRVKHSKDKKSILFYDGFGLDTRGLIQIYLKAFVKLEYKIIYVTMAENPSEQPKVMDILSKAKVYQSNSLRYMDRLNWLRRIAEEENFQTAFFYTTPYDVAAAIAFYELKDQCRRYQINLTDHAFWLGLNAFDYCIEYRDYGASISHYYRGIGLDRLVELPYYPVADCVTEFKGFPFDYKGKKVIFSGGAFYKTVDPELTFYRLVANIVSRHKEVIFLYAGSGDSSHINDLVRKYPGRVYYISERNDLRQVLAHSYLYLNTYPIGGGLMVQFAASAGCIPVTLKRAGDDSASGALMNEEKLGETFYDFDEVYNEIDKLLKDEQYWREKKELLSGMVITEEEFTKRLSDIIINPKITYNAGLRTYDTSLFLESYKKNLDNNEILRALINLSTKSLIVDFPLLTVKRCLMKIKNGL